MGKHSKPVGDLLIGDAAATYGSPMRDKDDGTYRGGRREDTCDHGLWLVQEVAEGKELLLVMVELEIKEKCCSKKYICQLPLRPSIPIVVFDLNNGILTKEHTDLFGSYLTYCKDDKNDSDFTVSLRQNIHDDKKTNERWWVSPLLVRSWYGRYGHSPVYHRCFEDT